jgi:nitrous oxide reductase
MDGSLGSLGPRGRRAFLQTSALVGAAAAVSTAIQRLSLRRFCVRY